MNRSFRCCLVALCIPALTACATQADVRHAPAVSRAPAQATTDSMDKAYVAAVERQARIRGVDVRWVNPPTRRVVALADADLP